MVPSNHQERLADPVGEVLDLTDGIGCRGHFLHTGLFAELAGHLGHVSGLRVSWHDAVGGRHDLGRHALHQLGLVGEQFLELEVCRFLVNIRIARDGRAAVQHIPDGAVLVVRSIGTHEDNELHAFLELGRGPVSPLPNKQGGAD